MREAEDRHLDEAEEQEQQGKQYAVKQSATWAGGTLLATLPFDLPGSNSTKGDEDELSRHKRERLSHWCQDHFQGGRIEPVDGFHLVVKARPEVWGQHFLEEVGADP